MLNQHTLAFGMLYANLRWLANEEHEIRIAVAGWIDSDSTVYGSFVWCCEQMGLVPQAVRKLMGVISPDQLAAALEDYESIDDEPLYEETYGETEDTDYGY